MATTAAGLQQVGVQAVVLNAAQFGQLSRQVEQQIEGMNKASHKLASEGSASFQKFSDVGVKALVSLTAALTAAFLAAQLLGGVNFLGAAASIEQGLAVVQSVSQGTQEQLGQLKDLVRALATTTVASFDDILTASAELARGGLEIEQQLGGALKSVINLTTAAAGELPFDKAARAIASAIPIFKLGAEETDRVANALVVAAQKSSASFNDIIRSFQQVAPLAPLLRIPIEDIAAAVGVLGQAGLRGSDAGTSLKQAFIQLFAPTKKAAELMNEYKINLFDANGAARPLGDTLLDLQDKFGDTAVASGKITEAARANALALIFGSDAIRAAALNAINGADAFFEMTSAMKDNIFTAEGLAKIISAPLQSQLKILQNNITAISTDIGEGFIPVIRSLVVELVKVAQAAAPVSKAIGDAFNFALSGTGFDELRDKLSDIFGSEIAASILNLFNVIRASIIEVVTSINGLIGKLQEISGTEQAVFATADAFYTMANAVQAVSAVTSSIIIGLTNLANLIATNEEAFWRFKTVLLSIVAGTTLAAFAGLITLIATLAATFSSILIPMLAVGIAGAAIVAILSSLGGSGTQAVQAIEEAFDEIDIVTPFTEAALEIPGVLEAIDFSFIVQNIAIPFEEAANLIGTELEELVIDSLAIADEVEIAFNSISIESPVGNLITDKQVGEISGNFAAIAASGQIADKELDAAFANMGNGLSNFAGEVAAENRDIGQSFEELGQGFSNLGTVGSAIFSAIGETFNLFGTLVNDVVTAITTAIPQVATAFLGLLDSLKGVSTGLDILIDATAAFVRSFIALFNGAVQGVMGAANAIIGAVNGIIGALNSLPGGGALNLVPAVALKNIVANIPDIASNIGNQFDRIGTDVRNTIDGITRRTGDLTTNLLTTNNAANTLAGGFQRVGEAGERSIPGTSGAGDAAKKAGKAAKEAGPAIEGFVDALAKAIRLQSFIDEFGDVGAKAIDSLVDAMVSNIDKDGAKAAEALHKFKQLLRTELVPDFEELGHEADAAFAQALIDRSDEAVEAAKDVVRRMAAAAKAQGALTLDTFKAAFDLGVVNNQLGSQGAKLMADLKKAIVEGGTDVVRAVGATAADIVSSFGKDLKPEQAREFTLRFMHALSQAIIEGTPEALTNFQNFAKQLNFDKEILKAQNTLNKAITDATKTYTESLAEAVDKQNAAIRQLNLEQAFKDQAEAEKAMLKDIVDGHIEGLKRQQDNERRIRRESKEDLRQQLEDERAADDLRLSRADQMADAIKAKRKRLSEQLKGEAPSLQDQASGRAIQGNARPPGEDEVKALEERWRKEDERAAIVLQRRKDDLVARRAEESADQLFELQLVAEFEQKKGVIEAPIRAAEKIAKQAAHNTAINNIVLQGNEQIAQLNRTLAQNIANAQLAFEDAKIKLEEEKTIADTVFDMMLADAQAITAELIKQKDLIAAMGASGKSGTIPVDEPPLGMTTVSSGGPQFPNSNGSWGQQVSISSGSDMLSSLSSSGGEGAIPGLPDFTRSTNQDLLAAVIGIRPMSRVDSLERSARPLNIGSTITNNNSYNVSANYNNWQSDADVRLDMQALLALTS